MLCAPDPHPRLPPRRYQKRWWGAFANPKVERLYRQRLWKTTSLARRGTIVAAVFAVAVHLYLVVRGFTLQADDNNAQPLRTVPSIVLCVAGQLVLFLGFTSWRWVIRRWDAIAFVGMGAMLTSYSSACVWRLATHPRAHGTRTHARAYSTPTLTYTSHRAGCGLWHQVRHTAV